MAKTKKIIKKYYKKADWSSNISNFSFNQIINANTQFDITVDLCENPVQDVSRVSQKFTVKNMNLQFMLEGDRNEVSQTDPHNNSIENLQMYILYIPQGFTITSNTPFEHPEWIMAYRFIGIPVEQNRPGYSSLRIRSRLARKLDTGDKVKLLLLGQNTGTVSTPIKGNGLLRYNTKAN